MKTHYDLLSVTTSTGMRILNPTEIMYCAADGSYTEINLECGEKIVFSKHLKVLQDNLPKELFLRIHHKHLVNRYYVSEIYINGGCHVILKNGKKLEISLKKKAQVIAAFKKI
ncbi:MAG: LytTR family DNA-binding domain-containing protein [Bacteroidota bacterium]